MVQHATAGPAALDSTMPLGTSARVAGAVGVAVLAAFAVVMLAIGPVSWPLIPELVSMQYVVMAAVCGFTALLLFGYAVASGRRGYLVLAGTYFYVAGINLVSPMFWGNGVLFGDPPKQFLGGTQSIVHIYVLWHFVFSLGVIAGALILESDRTSGRRPVLGPRTVATTVIVVSIALVVSVLMVALGRDSLPTMFVGATLTPFTRWLSAVYLPITVAGTLFVGVLVWRRGAPINRWLFAVLLVMVAESMVVLRPTRNMLTFYANLALAVVAMSALLVALLWTLSRVGRTQADISATDVGTGARTRTALLEALTQELDRARWTRSQVALLWLDLDGFQEVNDELGHEAGDEVLRQVAARLQAEVRPGDLVARLGGDEFGVLVSDSAGPVDDALVDEIAAGILEAIRAPTPTSDATALVTASIGIAVAAAGSMASEVMLQADVSMCAAKAAGGDGCQRFSEALGDQAVWRATLRHDLAAALSDRAFSLDFQPIMDAGDMSIAGAEALVRWDRNGVKKTAGQFVDFAERTGQIVGIGRLVVGMLERDVDRLLAAGGPAFFLSMNLSVKELATDSLVGQILAGPLARRTAQVVVEVTESFDLHADQGAVDNLARLREAGFAVAIDDFGSGYSNLTELTQLRPRFIKADRSLVEAATSGTKEGVALLAAAKAIADSLGCQVIAEGIETTIDEAIARALGLQYLQGYLYHGPMTLDDLSDALAAKSPTGASVETGDLSTIAFARFTREGTLISGNPRFLQVSGAHEGDVLVDFVVEGQRDHIRSLLDGAEFPAQKKYVHFARGDSVPASLLVSWAWDGEELELISQPPGEGQADVQIGLVRLNSRVTQLARESAKTNAQLQRALDEATTAQWDGVRSQTLEGGALAEDTLDAALAAMKADVIAAAGERLRGHVALVGMAEGRDVNPSEMVGRILGFWLDAIITDAALGSASAMRQSVGWLDRLREGHDLPFDDAMVLEMFEVISSEIAQRLDSPALREQYAAYQAPVQALIASAFPQSAGPRQ